MEHQLLFVALLFATAAGSPVELIQPRVTESNDISYRLSGKIIPSSYVVSLLFPEEVFTEGFTGFSGIVEIIFKVTEPTNIIDIHAPNNLSTVTLSEQGVNIGLNLTFSNLNDTTSVVIIELMENLDPELIYSLTINYIAELDPLHMSGPYLSYYRNATGIDKYMVTTQFQPDNARKAFPCFDEPEYKAIFQFILVYPKGLLALTNTPAISEADFNATHTATLFDQTPIMSTYLVAFAISEFTCDGLEEIEEGVPHQVCSRADVQGDRTYANQWGPIVMHALENITGIKYSQSIKKMDQIAIPDFSAGAMENWGLVTYREMALLFNNGESSAGNKETIVTIIAHEFAHMWFGNLVTTKWWNTLFLNEGFASYYECFAPASIPELEVDEQWELAKQFILDQQQSVFVSDGLLSSPALSSQASTSGEIWGKFSSISYLKGASIIRMVNNFMGEENFENGIKEYLVQNQYQAAQPWNLWEALQKHVPEEVLPFGVSLETVMSNWINASGYPVVTVSADGNDVILSQKRFLYNNETSNTTWFVPISYTTAANTSTFEDVSPKLWLLPSTNHLGKLENVLENNNWIVLNNQESAYYRVNYDQTLWERIRTALLNDHTQFNVLNRAQIVDDAINLARAGEITYPQAFGILSYLKSETEYYPIYSALSGLDFLTRVFGETSEIGMEINKFQLELLEEIRKNVSFDLGSVTSHIEIKKARLVLGRLCKLQEGSCITESKNLFQEFITTQSIDPNLKSIVFCNALRHSENQEEDWNYLWRRFQNLDVATEQVLLLSVLGCTRNETLLERYLEESLNETSGIRHQDISRVWSSVVTSNPEGVLVAIKFYASRHEDIIARYSSSISVLGTAAARATSNEHIAALQEFANSTTIREDVKRIADGALASAQANIDWASARENQFKEHFGLGTTGGFAVRPLGGMAAVVILGLFTIIFR